MIKVEVGIYKKLTEDQKKDKLLAVEDIFLRSS